MKTSFIFFIVLKITILCSFAQNCDSLSMLFENEMFDIEKFNICPVKKIDYFERYEMLFDTSELRIESNATIAKRINKVLDGENIYKIANKARIKLGIDTLNRINQIAGEDTTTNEPITINVFSYQKDTFLLVTFTEFNGASTNYPDFVKLLINICNNKIELLTFTTVRYDECFGDFNCDGVLDFAYMNWTTGEDTPLKLYSYESSGFFLNNTYFLKEKKKSYYPDFDKNTSYIKILCDNGKYLELGKKP